MKTYQVWYESKLSYCVELEAESLEDAEDRAFDIIGGDEDSYFSYSGDLTYVRTDLVEE